MTSKARSSPVAASSARRASSSLPTRRRTSGARIADAAIYSLTYPPCTSAGVGRLSSLERPATSSDDSQRAGLHGDPDLVVVRDVVAVDLPRYRAAVAR